MVSPKQIEKARKVQVLEKEVVKTDKSISIPMVYVDKVGTHERTVTFKRNSEGLKACLSCFCTYCSNYAVNSNDLCIYKLRAIKWLIYNGYFEKWVWDIITNPMGVVE